METWSLPDGWKWVRIDEVCEVNPRRRDLHRDENAPTSFLPMAAVDEVKGSIADLETRPYCEVRRGYKYFEEGDVLFAKITPSMQNGKAAIARKLIDGLGFGSTEFHVLRPSEEVIPEWIHLFVRRFSFREEAIAHFRGSVGQQRVPSEFLVEHLMPVPSTVEVQRRIVTRVETLFADITTARSGHMGLVQEAEQLMQASLRDVFADLMSTAAVASIADLLERGQLEMVGGGTPSRKRADFWNGDIPWISPKDMKSWWIIEAEDHITSEALSASSAKLIPADSVLVVVRGMILDRTWPVAVNGIEVTINQDMKAITPKEDIMAEYLAYALRALEPAVLPRIGTAAHGTKRLETEALTALEIPMIPMNEQGRVVARMDEVRANVSEFELTAEAISVDLGRLEQSILSQAFRGEL